MHPQWVWLCAQELHKSQSAKIPPSVGVVWMKSYLYLRSYGLAVREGRESWPLTDCCPWIVLQPRMYGQRCFKWVYEDGWGIQTTWKGENGKQIWVKHIRSIYEILKQHILKVERNNKLNFVLGKITLCWMLPHAFNPSDWKQGQADHSGSLASQNTEILV